MEVQLLSKKGGDTMTTIFIDRETGQEIKKKTPLAGAVAPSKKKKLT